jgi:hypothetical protein
MTAIAFLLIMIGIGAVIEGYHGNAIWSALVNLFQGQGTGQGSTSTK